MWYYGNNNNNIMKIICVAQRSMCVYIYIYLDVI
jgi:hypothetical protein